MSERARDEYVPARKRFGLIGAAVVFGVYLVYIVLTLFTSVLDGSVGGVGVAYLAGFVVIALGFVVALAYTRWADARDREA